MSALIEKLERECDRLHKISVDFSHDTRLRLINEALGICRAINIVKQHSEHSDWISVDERLPEDNQEVLAILELTGFYMLSFVSNGIWYNADDGEQIARHKDRQAVTYWMPTPPQPPSEVQP